MADVAKLTTAPDLPVEKSALKKELPEENASSPKDYHSSNSHHHDSEYDTASDLEGADDEDCEEEEDDDSIFNAQDDDDIDSENGSIVFDLERQRGDGQEQNEYSKKVDEDRSNPQYIPKKGTFYEHDDRTADEPENLENKGEENTESETINSSTPTISASSKTMKKWQPASAVDRWSHDRFDESEQAPKSRSELVSAYGYDIRNEDGPPRARRRRRYGRGPSKYSRNWEDESAYVKSTTTTQRKPRSEDFPALGDQKKIKKVRSFRDEKENRYDRHGERSNARSSGTSNVHEEKIERKNSGKNYRSGRHTMEFKNQNRKRLTNENTNERISGNRQLNKEDVPPHGNEDAKIQVESVSFTNTKITPQNDRFNGPETAQGSQIPNRDVKEKMALNTNMVMNRQTQPPMAGISTSRLQVQNRHETSQVGNMQIHSMITPNSAEIHQQHQQQAADSGRTKRYSSLRQRSQNDVGFQQPSPHDQHSLQQQMHSHDVQKQQHQQPPPPQQPQHVILQDQHLLPTNLMQLYHPQDNIQAQIQGVTLQSLSGVHAPKPPYQNVQQYPPAGTAPAYYAPTNEFAAGTAQPPPTPVQYTQPQPPAYIQPQHQQAPPQPIAYATAPQQAVPPPPQQIPPALNYVQTPPAPQPAAPYQGFPSYQNYNTVGGTTYFVPQQPTPRPVALTQRRTNAIPILAPPTEKTKSSRNEREDDSKNMVTATANAPIGSVENIDHILDNMFVQRPPYQPPARKSSSPTNESNSSSTSNAVDDKAINKNTADDNRLEDAIKSLSITEGTKVSEQLKKPVAESDVQDSSSQQKQNKEIAHNETG